MQQNPIKSATMSIETLSEKLVWHAPTLCLLALIDTESTGSNLFEDQVGGGIAHS